MFQFGWRPQPSGSGGAERIIFGCSCITNLAAAKLAEAAAIIDTEPVALELPYLQTLTEIGVDENTTVVFPVPIDILKNRVRGSA